MSGLVVSVCESCGWQGFPTRLWCPQCGATEVGSSSVEGGTVEQTTVIQRAIGRDLGEGVRIGLVRLDGGGTAIARLEGGAACVRIFEVDGAPVGRGREAER